mgnify:CR=1 FL=1
MCLYEKIGGDYVLIYLYDDMLIIQSNNDMIMSTKKMLTKRFDMKDLGVADVILGMKITKKLLTNMLYLNLTMLRRF